MRRSDWKSTTIGSLGRIVTGKTPTSAKPELFGVDYPFITPSDLDVDRPYVPTERFLSAEGRDWQKNQILPKGSVCFTCIGATIGKLCKTDRPSFSNQQINSVVVDDTEHDAWFVYYLLRFHGKEIASIASGAATPIVNKTTFAGFEISVPSHPIQRKIASILSAYDDLIENNTRRIAILEEMAQAIYREWFVNFRFPGHENVKLVDSSAGEIPQGWEASTLESVLTFYIGGGWGKEAEEAGFTERAAVIRGTDIPNAKHMNVSTCPTRFHQESNIRSRRLQNGDIVFEVSGGSKGQPVGRCVFASDRLLSSFADDVICASFCKLIRPNSEKLCSPLFFHYLLEAYTNGIIEQYEVQSTGIKNFKFTEFLAREHITVPPTEIQRQFLMQFEAMQSQIEILGKKASNLRTTRDLLLPKLISGQLDVEDLDIDVSLTAEELTEAAAG